MMSYKKNGLLWTLVVATALIALLIAACSGDGDDTGDSSEPGESQAVDQPTSMSTDEELVQAMFDEAATRWSYGDKGVLYDLEFEYLQKENTFDEYLAFRQVAYLEADTLASITVDSLEFFDRDSAYATATAMFVGPAGDTTYMPDQYRLYFHRGRWIHPTVSTIDMQLEFDERRRVADSAVAAEAELEGR